MVQTAVWTIFFTSYRAKSTSCFERVYIFTNSATMEFVKRRQGKSMKIKIEIDENLTEEEIVIRGSSLTEEMATVQKAVADLLARKQTLTFYKNETEFYIPLDEILFFETEDGGISAHTASDVYAVKYKLYELEQVLPRNFIRVSKSTILNASKVYSVERNLTASSVVAFANSHKQVYVSRYYYKSLKISLEEKRLK